MTAEWGVYTDRRYGRVWLMEPILGMRHWTTDPANPSVLRATKADAERAARGIPDAHVGKVPGGQVSRRDSKL